MHMHLYFTFVSKLLLLDRMVREALAQAAVTANGCAQNAAADSGWVCYGF